MNPERDRWGRYLVPAPATGKKLGYTRVTTVAKTLSDEYGLTEWKMRQVAKGLVARPDLLAAVSSTDDKKELSRICADAMDAVGSSTGRTLGTALHALTEQIDRGEQPQILDVLQRDITAYTNVTRSGVFEILPEWIEVVLVLDDHQVAGTADRLVRLPDGRICVADLKTGGIDFAGGEIAIQLAAYAMADAAYDYDTGTRRELPAIDQQQGIVIHLPAGEGRCTLHWVDLAAGREAFERAMWTRQWRKRKDVLVPLSITDTPAPTPDPEVARLHALLRRHLEALRDDNPAALPVVAAAWPDGVPTLREAPEAHTLDGLKLVEALLEEHVGFILDSDHAAGLREQRRQRRDGVVARLKELPADLLGSVTVLAKQAGIPRLTSGEASDGHLDQVETFLVSAEAAHAERVARLTQRVAETASRLGLDDDDVAWLVEQSGATSIRGADNLHAERVEALCAGYEAQVFDRGADALIDLYGARSEALTVGRAVAARHNLPTPRSCDDIAADRVLLALTLNPTN